MRFRTFPAAVALLSASLPFSLQDGHGDPCAEIAKQWAESKNAVHFPPDLAQACLKSVPFDGERSRFVLDQLKLYFQFFSAQSYHLHPPSFFEVLPVDTNNTFEYFYGRVDGEDDGYKNNLEFDQDLMHFFGSYRHAGMEYLPACSGAFIFRHDHPLFAVSPKNPTDEPQIHVVLDPWDVPRLGPEVDTIDGQPVIDYLKKLTGTLPSLKYLDPDARWNDLFFHRSNTDARLGAFAQRFIYPEGQPIIIKYKDGAEVTPKWTADVYQGISELTSDGEHLPWTDGASFLKNVCLRPMDPETCKAKDKSYSIHKRGLHTKRDDHPLSMWGYPTPVLHSYGHEVSLFEYEAYSVLAISSFDPHPGNIQDGMEFLLDFLQTFHKALESIKAYDKKVGKKRLLLLDLSHNDGGRQILAHEAARMLLPDADHFFLVNRRWSPALRDLMIAGFSENHASVFNYRYYKDENGKDFKDAHAALGPVCNKDDCFTHLMMPDHEQIMTELWGKDYVDPSDSYWSPSDIVVVADGLCNGPCGILLEAMQSQKVKVAAFGGRPGSWKMQGAGGLKAHSPAIFEKIDEEIYYVLGKEAWDNKNMPKPLPLEMLWGSVGLENRFRKGEDTPMEFVRCEATWTSKFTKAMFNSAEAIWKVAYDLATGQTQKEEADAEFETSDRAVNKAPGDSQDSPPKSSPQEDRKDKANDDLLTKIRDWHYGTYIVEFFHGYSPEEIFDVKKLWDNSLEHDDDKNDD